MILTCGLSPAWQHIMVVDGLLPGDVNRASEVHWCASGKVLNAAIAIAHLQGCGHVVSVLGGPCRADIEREFESRELETTWVGCNSPTRVCTTVIDSGGGTATELVENAGELNEAEWRAFEVACRDVAGAADLVLMMGSIPRGVPRGIYREILQGTTGRAVLDLCGEELLEAVKAGPCLVKPNPEELERTLGRKLEDEAEVLSAMMSLNDLGAAWVVVTSGAGPTLATSEGKSFRFLPPPVDRVNSIGCGDCMSGALALALDEGQSPLEAIRFGMGAAADNLGQVLMGRLDRGRVEEFAGQVGIEEISPA